VRDVDRLAWSLLAALVLLAAIHAWDRRVNAWWYGGKPPGGDPPAQCDADRGG
jgi:hypothetical protein